MDFASEIQSENSGNVGVAAETNGIGLHGEMGANLGLAPEIGPRFRMVQRRMDELKLAVTGDHGESGEEITARCRKLVASAADAGDGRPAHIEQDAIVDYGEVVVAQQHFGLERAEQVETILRAGGVTSDIAQADHAVEADRAHIFHDGQERLKV